MRTTIQLQKILIPPIGCHLILTVKLNNKRANLVLDTGASRSVIDKEYLEEILPDLIHKDETNESAGVGASDLKSSVASIAVFKIGRILIRDFQLAVMDLSHVKNSYLQIGEHPIYGVIGGDILEKYAAKIDYSKLKLTLIEITELPI